MANPKNRSELSDTPAAPAPQAEKPNYWPGPRIRELLRGRELKWLAEKTGISASTISDFAKRGGKAETALRIAEALDTTVEYLMLGTTRRAVPNLIPADDADWVSLERFDLRRLSDMDKGDLVESLPFRKDWLFRQLNRSSGLWLAELPSDYQPDDLTEGDLIVCSDIIEGDGPKDRWLCIFRGAAGPFVGRYSEAPGLRSNERPNETIIAPANLIDGEIRPVARIHARLIARL